MGEQILDGYHCLRASKNGAKSHIHITSALSSADVTRSLWPSPSPQMSHLYDNAKLWTYVCMVGFAEHYVDGASLAQVDAIMRRYDVSGDQRIDLNEFLTLVLEMTQFQELCEKADRVFKAHDVDHSGSLDATELRAALRDGRRAESTAERVPPDAYRISVADDVWMATLRHSEPTVLARPVHL